MSAHLCLTAWKEPIGRPNWIRTFAYSTDMSRTLLEPPPDSARSIAGGFWSAGARPARPRARPGAGGPGSRLRGRAPGDEGPLLIAGAGPEERQGPAAPAGEEGT